MFNYLDVACEYIIMMCKCMIVFKDAKYSMDGLYASKYSVIVF